MSFVDTSLLTVRNVTAYNSKERQTHILSNSAPAIDSIGYLKWKNSFEFVRDMQEFSPTYTIQPGLSSVITPADENIKNLLQSTFAGLPNTGYLNSGGFEKYLKNVTYTYGYIQSSSLNDCINRLTKLEDITRYVPPMVKFIRSSGNVFEPISYIQTENPGKYRIHTSTLGLQGSNLINTPINNSGVITSGIIDIGGYSNLIIPGVSKMRIDVNIGLEHTTLGTFSTFLCSTDVSLGTPVETLGTPVVVNYLTPPAAPIGKITYFLTAADFINTPNKLWIGHRGNVTNATTAIPSFGGIHVTLNNMD
jgi:hypothetical protein